MSTDEYLSATLRIGFMQHFPVAEIVHTQEEEVELTYRYFKGRLARIKVSLCRCTFGDSNEYSVFCVVTERWNGVSEALGSAASFGSFCHEDEAFAMEKAVAQYCEKQGLIICSKECSWPFAKAVTSIKDTKYWDQYAHHFPIPSSRVKTSIPRRRRKTDY